MTDALDRLKAALADRYAIERELGAGGMATVYLAEDLKHHRKVAVKVLRPELAAVLGAERFVHEITTTANLQHPHILPLFDSGEADSFLYYVMPFVDGETLRDKLNREKQLAVEETVEIAKSVAAALDYAHDQGVIHRDIKPENILLQQGQALVADFGIALAVRQAGGTRLTATGLSLGTPQYMSPEQATGDRELDARSDVYALGCVLYEMLEGHPAFEGNTAQALIASKVMGEVPELAADTLVPATVAVVTLKALAAAPEDRYPTTADFAQALETAMTTDAIEADAIRRRRARGRRMLGAVAGIALMASGSWWVSTLLSGPRIERVALLPLENERDDSTQDFFIEGMHDALITEMGQAGIKVIGRRSVMRYRDDKVTPVREIARVLNVDAVIEGFAFREGDSVAIRVRLVDGATETALWSASFGTAARDVIRLYRQVTGAIAREIQLTLSPEVAARLASAPSVDPAAYEAYLNGMYHWYRLTPQGLDLAEQYFQRALEVDPDYALAHKGIAAVWGGRQQFGLVSPAEAGPMVRAAARRALAADSTVAEVQFALAVQRTWSDYDWDAADHAFQRALELNPSYAEARAFYSHLLVFLARPDEASEQADLAVTMDPLNPLISGLSCVTLSFVGRNEEAIERCQGVLRSDPTQPVAHDGLGNALRNLRRYDETQVTLIARARAMGDDEMERMLETGYAEGGFERAMALMAETLVVRSEVGFVPPGWIAYAFFDAGDMENALDWFERGVDIRDPTIPYLAASTWWEELEAHPRFRELVRRMGLP